MLDKRLLMLPLAAFIALAAGCVDDDESVEPSPNPYNASAVGFKAEFHPLAAIAPFPNDIYIGTDGTVDVPVADPTDFGDPQVAMNELDGFSLNAAIQASFNDSIDEATLVGGIPGVQPGTVYVFNVTDAQNPVLLVPGVDYSLGLSPGQSIGQRLLQITPLHPLEEQSRYAVILTSGIQNSAGDAAGADTVFQQMKDSIAAGTTLSDPSLEAIKDQQVAPLLQLAAGIGLSADDVILAWTFSTQSIGESLTEIEANATAQPVVVTAFLGTTNTLLGTTVDATPAEVYAGMIQLPYYLDQSAPLTGFWQTAAGASPTRFNPAPEATGTITVPLLITVPAGGSWDTVIFQHGITQDRTNLLAVADALANAGKAGIAIDLPLHGITDDTSPLFAPADGSNPLYPDVIGAVTEPHFYLDVLNNSTGAAGSDGEIDGSGESFINLTSLLTSRDNLRQAAANLIHLVKTVDNGIAYNGAGGGSTFTLTGASGFAGHSLGGITGTVFLGVNSDVGAATLGMPGGNISQLLQDSPTFAPRINAGLEAAGLIQGTQLYYDFFRNAQTVVDSGDPINYAAAANASHAVHMIEVVGGGGNPPDQVVPNSATEALSNAMGLACIDAGTAAPTGEGIVRFVAGDHGSLLDPAASQEATVEMQTELATFIASFGTTVWNPTPTFPAVIASCP